MKTAAVAHLENSTVVCLPDSLTFQSSVLLHGPSEPNKTLLSQGLNAKLRL